MLLQNKLVAIIGGGPGGLTLAKLLQLKGVLVKVYERDFDKFARVQGSPLDMHEESGLAAIRKAGLLNAFKKNYRPGADRMVITNEQGIIFLSDHESGDKPEEDFGSQHFRPEIDRGPLRHMLLESLQTETVVWNSQFISMQQQDEGWLIYFKNGSTAYADLVIAADGANSKIRPYLTSIQPFYSGITMIEGIVHDAVNLAPRIHALTKGGKIMAFGNEKNILLGQKGNGDLGFYMSLKLNRDWTTTSELDFGNRREMLSWYQSVYSEWSEIWLELFEKSAMPFIPRPIYCIPFDQTWEALPNLTMIGDAAHVMPPFAGEGANMAMLDALELSESLTADEYPSLKEAIGSYEFAMRPRAANAAKESLENGNKMHSSRALEDMLEFFNAVKSAD